MEQDVLEGFHLAPQQKHLWALQQADEALPQWAYCTIQIDGVLDHALLEQTLQTLAARHEILRTAFRYLPEMSLPLQVVTDSNLELRETVDWSQATAAEQQANIDTLLVELEWEPVQVAEGPFVSATVAKLAHNHHLLFLAMPALYADVATFRNLIQEISSLYEAQEQETEVEKPVQYIDLSEWQNELIEAEEGEPGRAFWNRQALLKRMTTLPFARKTSDHHPFTPCTISVTLPEAVTADLQNLAERYDTSADLLLLACWQLLLWRLVEQPEIVVGMAFEGRKYEELEQALGLFAKYLPIHTTLEAGRPFEQVLQSVTEAVSEAYDYQEFFSWEQLLTPSQNGFGLPFMSICFNYVNWPQPTAANGLTFSLGRYAAPFDRFQLNLTCTRREQSLTAAFTYDVNCYRPEDIASLAEQFQMLLQAVAAAPQTTVDKLQLLNEAERQRLLYDYNDTVQEFPQNSCIHRLFEEQVDCTPENTALVCGQQTLTYAELDKRANQLAHHLQSQGVEPNAIVAIGLNHAVETVVAILGVLKAGGTYLPLDPAHPKERIAFMLDDAGAALVLTTQDMVGVYSAERQAKLLCLDSQWERIAQHPDTRPTSDATATDLAYLIYTSGSTGQPKGTKISHRSLINYIWWAKAVYLQGERLNFSLYSSLAFDLTVTSIYTPLLSGSALVIYNIPGSDIATILEDNQSGILKLTPSHLSLLRNRDNSHASIKRLIVGGEAFETALAQEIYESFGGQVEIYNEYGPTEATVGCMIYQFDPERDADRSFVPIGKPVANTRIYLLDEQIQPVARNVAGEIYIGGAGVAKGYLNRLELTEARFVADPFHPGGKMYRTGDFGRLLSDGSMAYIGRRDDQVKLHGYRVELNEIRAALKRHARIEDSVAVTAEDSHGHSVLIVYYIANQEIEADELRTFLRQYLIEETIPNFFARIDQIPLTPNGKIDSKKLPTLAEIRQKARRKYVAPRTETEEVLVEIWEKILETERVGIHDDFFALGGHSLLGTQIMARIQTVFKVELPLRTLFNAPTPAAMAEKIDAVLQEQKDPFQLTEHDMPTSFAQQRLWFLDQLFQGVTAHNIPVTVRFQGVLDAADIEQIINKVVQRHETLRTTFIGIEGVPYQRIAPQIALLLPVADLSDVPSAEQEQEVQRLVDTAVSEPFDLSTGPLLRARLLKLADEDHILLLTMHNIIFDEWSTAILLREIAALAEALETESQAQLPQLPIQYADFAHWQRERVQGETLESTLAYWREQFSDPPAILNLPTDRPRPKMPSGQGGSEMVELSPEVYQRLNQLNAENDATLFTTLLAAFKALLFHYTRQTDLVIGTLVSGRDEGELENLIGFVGNTLALRTVLSDNPTFLDLLQQVNKVVAEARDHDQLPFEKLIDELDVQRDMGHTPLFQAMFTLQDAPQAAWTLASSNITLLTFSPTTAKFDLTMAVTAHEQDLTVSLVYNADLFERGTIRRMLAHFQSLLAGITADPHQPITALPLFGQQEREQVLLAWNDTYYEAPQGGSIIDRFEEWAARRPDAAAVSFQGRCLSYGELNGRANQLAHSLKESGIGPERLVGICVDRSLEMVVGILAVLKAGGAYLPLDPAYPDERLAFMLADAGAAVLLTQADMKERFKAAALRLLCLDADWEKTAATRPQTNLNVHVTGQHLAYVIYTSGSTGQPKGVQISHEGLLNLINWHQRTFTVTPDDRATQIAGLAFDASVWELWPYLTAGASLHLVPDEPTRTLPEQLQDWLVAQEITISFLPTPLAEAVLSLDWPASCSLRTLLTGGDKVHHYPDPSLPFALINNYGPTENTVVATSGPVLSQEKAVAAPDIGRPIDNHQIYLLNDQMRPVPIGVPGELYISGPSLARGYRGQPGMTAERFVPNPFGSQAGTRLYRTGDLARYRTDGRIEFLGRLDEQVKVRGFRIELGEIEAVLRQHPEVREALVLTDGQTNNDTQLIAYIVSSEEIETAAGELRTFLQQRLPSYMIPVAFIPLETVPLTPNGKVDKRRLPMPDISDRRFSAGQLVFPRTPAESLMSSLWCEVLGVEKISIYDNFFHLGGHSLKATQLKSRVRDRFGADLPLTTIFEAPVLVDMVETVLVQQASETDDQLLDELLTEVEQMSDEELEALLAAEQESL